jgi:hypothetical protein
MVPLQCKFSALERSGSPFTGAIMTILKEGRHTHKPLKGGGGPEEMAQRLRALTSRGLEFNSQQPHCGSQPSICSGI